LERFNLTKLLTQVLAPSVTSNYNTRLPTYVFYYICLINEEVDVTHVKQQFWIISTNSNWGPFVFTVFQKCMII